MSRFPGVEQLQEVCTAALSNCLLGGPAAVHSVLQGSAGGQPGAVAMVATAVCSHADNMALLESACGFFAAVSTTHDGRQELLNWGLLSVVQHAFDVSVHLPSVRTKALVVIRNLCSDPALVPDVVSSGGLPRVYAAIEAMPHDSAVVTQACAAIACVAKTPAGLMTVASSESAARLLAVLFSDDGSVCWSAAAPLCALLASLPVAAAHFAHGSTLTSMHRALRQHKDSTGVVSSLLTMIARTARDASCHVVLCGSGVLDDVTSLMEAHASDVGVQVSGCRVWEEVAAASPPSSSSLSLPSSSSASSSSSSSSLSSASHAEADFIAAARQAIDALLHALTVHASSLDVHRAVSRALRSLSSCALVGRHMIEAGVGARVFHVLALFGSDEDVVCSCVGVLSKLVAADDGFGLVVVQSKGTLAVVRALASYPSTVSLQRDGLVLIATLAANTQFIPTLCIDGCLDSVLAICDRHCGDEEVRAKFCLRNSAMSCV